MVHSKKKNSQTSSRVAKVFAYVFFLRQFSPMGSVDLTTTALFHQSTSMGTGRKFLKHSTRSGVLTTYILKDYPTVSVVL